MFGPVAVSGARERARKEESAYLDRDRTPPPPPPPLRSPPATPCTPGTANTAWRERPRLPSASSQLRTPSCPTVPPPPRGPAPLPGPPPAAAAAALGSPGPPRPPPAAAAAAAGGSRPAPGARPGPWRWVGDPRRDGSGPCPGLCGAPAGSRPPLGGRSRDLTSCPPATAVAAAKPGGGGGLAALPGAAAGRAAPPGRPPALRCKSPAPLPAGGTGYPPPVSVLRKTRTPSSPPRVLPSGFSRPGDARGRQLIRF